MSRKGVWLGLFVTLIPGVVMAQAVVIDLTVEELSIAERTGEPVTSGVPIPKGAAGYSWALFDTSTEPDTEIPVATQLLPAARIDGELVVNPWLLLDFQAGVQGPGTTTYQLRSQAPTVSPNPAVMVTGNSGNTWTVTTGPLKVEIKKSSFNLFEKVWLVQGASSQLVFDSIGQDNLLVIDATGAMHGGKGTAVMTWETLNPLRATLRVDGQFGSSSDPILRYTTRITFHAGQTFVTVQHLLKNSVQFKERYVKLRSAKLRVGGSSVTARSIRSGDKIWTRHTSGEAIELIPARVVMLVPDGACAEPNPNICDSTIRRCEVDVDANNGLVIGDMSYHGATVRFDFAQNLSPAEITGRTAAFKDRLVARAAPEWYSEQGAFASEKFGTYQDEKDAYTRWGWTPNPNPIGAEHSDLRPSGAYYPSWSFLHPSGEPLNPESDDTWMHLLMYARTGLRQFLDRADGFARYTAWEKIPRTDGFPFAWDAYGEGVDLFPERRVTRERAGNDLPSGTFNTTDESYIDLNICNTEDERRSVGHMWGGGLVDYYYLTGDFDALEAAKDLAEMVKRHTEWLDPGTAVGGPNGVPRGHGRAYMNLLRVWEGTNDAGWRSEADRVKALVLQAPSNPDNEDQGWDPRGFYYTTTASLPGTIPTRYPNGKHVNSFAHGGPLTQALYRDWVLTGDAALRQRLLDMASFAFQHGSNAAGYTGDEIVVDSPSPGVVQHLGYNEFRGWEPLNPISAGNSRSYIDALTIASRLQYDGRYLAKAKELWSNASRSYFVGDTPWAQPTQVGRFVNHLHGTDDLVYFLSGDLTWMTYFFYEAARQNYCASAADCDDGLFCTQEVCTNGVCSHPPTQCTSPEPYCYSASCDEGADECALSPTPDFDIPYQCGNNWCVCF